MSYDLYFFKSRNSSVTEDQIATYLNQNLDSTSENKMQWFVENEDTETYYSFDRYDPNSDHDDNEPSLEFEDLENTNFAFNLNYLRPDFFGRFAFEFVDKFIEDLDLLVLNPQLDKDLIPFKPKPNELYKNWSEINSKHSSSLFKEYQLQYYPVDRSNEFYNYNLNKPRLQDKLGDNYYVPKLYLFKKKENGEIVTVSSWTEHIPNVFPPADYVMLIRKYKKLFRTVTEVGLINSTTFKREFGHLLSTFEFPNCQIIHPENSLKAKSIFNSVKLEHKIEDFVENIQIERIVNVLPEP